MEKLLFVAFIGDLVACGEATTETTTTDSPVVAATDTTAPVVADTTVAADTSAPAAADTTAK